MANSSQLLGDDDGATIDNGFPLLSLGVSQPSDPRPSCLAPPATTATLNLSVPSLPQSHASDELALHAATLHSPQHQQHDNTAEPTSAAEEHRPNKPLTQLSQLLAEDGHEQEADEQLSQQQQQQQQQQSDDYDSDGEPTWETVHPDIADDDEAGGGGSGSGAREQSHSASASATVDDSLGGAMELSLFDDGSQLPDDDELALQATRATAASQRNLIASLPAFPSLPSGLRTPPPVIPSTPSPTSERPSPNTGNGQLAVATGGLSPRSPHVVQSSIGIASSSPPSTSPQPALPATEPVSSSSSSSSSASTASSVSLAAEQPASPPEPTRRTSTYSQETNPVLSLHSSSSSSSPSPSLPSHPQPPTGYSQHPSMPALEQATGDQPDMHVDELLLLHDGERQSVPAEAARDEDGFVRPALPQRQATQERRSGGSQRAASQSILSPPHSPLRSSPHSPVQCPPRPTSSRSSQSSSVSSPARSAAVAATSPATPPRAPPSLSPQLASVQSLASQLQSQVESQAWDLSYHYPELDAAAREQLIAERGLTAVYGQTSAAAAESKPENTAEDSKDGEQSEAVEEAGKEAGEPVALDPHHEGQQSLEFDIDVDLSDHEDDDTSYRPAEQQAAQYSPSLPIAHSTFCSQDSDDIPQFTISAQHSFTSSSPLPSAPPVSSVPPPPAVHSPVYTVSSSPSLSLSPLSPPLAAAAPTSHIPAAVTNHVARRTRSQIMPQQPQPAMTSAPLRHRAAALAQQHEDEREQLEEEEEQEDEDEPQKESRVRSLDRQLSIDPEHPSSDTVLQQRQLMRDIRKQQRHQEKARSKPAAAATSAAHSNAPTRMNRQLSRDRHEQRTRAEQRQAAVTERQEQISSEEEEEEVDDDFVPRSGKRPYSATRVHSRVLNKKTSGRAQGTSTHGRAREPVSEQDAQQAPRSSHEKRHGIAEDAHVDESEQDEEDDDKENEQQAQGKQWKRLRKPNRGDTDRSQTATASGKKVKASERAGKLRQSSLLEHYSSTPTPPVTADELLDFTPDPAPTSLPPPALRTPAMSRHIVTSKPALTSTPTTAPPLFASVDRHSSTSSSSTTTSTSSPSRPSATVSIATRRGLVDITNTASSRQRPPPPGSPTKQPSNGWRTKRRKGDDGTEWEESPPSKRLDAVRPQQGGSMGGGTRIGLRRSAANVGSMRRRQEEAGERAIVVLDATQDPDG